MTLLHCYCVLSVLIALLAVVNWTRHGWSVAARAIGVVVIAIWAFACWRSAEAALAEMEKEGYYFSVMDTRVDPVTSQANLATVLLLIPFALAPFVLVVRAELRQMDAEARQSQSAKAATSHAASDASPGTPNANGSEPDWAVPRSADTAALKDDVPLN